MLEGPQTNTINMLGADDAVLVSRDLLERLQGELKFKQARIKALHFEVARLKRWRFGSSSESLEATMLLREATGHEKAGRALRLPKRKAAYG